CQRYGHKRVAPPKAPSARREGGSGTRRRWQALGGRRSHGMPQRDGGKIASGYRDGEQSPRARRVRRWPGGNAQLAIRGDYDPAKRPRQCVPRGLAHGFLAGPQPQQRAPAFVSGEPCERRLLVSGHELARDAIDVELAFAMFDVAADAGVRGQAEDGHAVGMGDVEIERPAVDDVGASARAATDLHVGGDTPEAPAEQDPERGAARDIAIPEVGTTE